jgi:hypothetical protein
MVESVKPSKYLTGFETRQEENPPMEKTIINNRKPLHNHLEAHGNRIVTILILFWY